MNIGNKVGRPADVRTFAASPNIVDNSAYVGYELEIEGVRNEVKLSSLWSTKGDGSLRNGGVECVFAEPLRGQDIVNAIEEVTSLFSKKIKGVMSHRCGGHVHIDVRDMTEEQLSSFIAHAVMYERALYSYAGDDRDSNIFCLPYYKAEDGLSGFGWWNQSGDVTQLFGTVDKYYGINLKAIQRYGSVEFRMLPGTLDYSRIITWINTLLSLRKVAMSGVHINDLLGAVSGKGVLEYAHEVFSGVPEFLPHIREHDVYKGMRLVQGFINWRGLSVAYKYLPKKLTARSLLLKFAKANGISVISVDQRFDYRPDKIKTNIPRLHDIEFMMPDIDEAVVAEPPELRHVFGAEEV